MDTGRRHDMRLVVPSITHLLVVLIRRRLDIRTLTPETYVWGEASAGISGVSGFIALFLNVDEELAERGDAGYYYCCFV